MASFGLPVTNAIIGVQEAILSLLTSVIILLSFHRPVTSATIDVLTNIYSICMRLLTRSFCQLFIVFALFVRLFSWHKKHSYVGSRRENEVLYATEAEVCKVYMERLLGSRHVLYSSFLEFRQFGYCHLKKW